MYKQHTERQSLSLGVCLVVLRQDFHQLFGDIDFLFFRWLVKGTWKLLLFFLNCYSLIVCVSPPSLYFKNVAPFSQHFKLRSQHLKHPNSSVTLRKFLTSLSRCFELKVEATVPNELLKLCRISFLVLWHYKSQRGLGRRGSIACAFHWAAWGTFAVLDQTKGWACSQVQTAQSYLDVLDCDFCCAYMWWFSLQPRWRLAQMQTSHPPAEWCNWWKPRGEAQPYTWAQWLLGQCRHHCRAAWGARAQHHLDPASHCVNRAWCSISLLLREATKALIQPLLKAAGAFFAGFSKRWNECFCLNMNFMFGALNTGLKFPVAHFNVDWKVTCIFCILNRKET